MSTLPFPKTAAVFWLFFSFAALANAGNAETFAGQQQRIDVGGFKLNSILIEAGAAPDLPPIVFIHGASTSLYDPLLSFHSKLEGRARLLFVDRPGHGGSDAGGAETILPDAQADAIARLMEARGIGKAIIVGHSFGGAVVAAFALRHPDKVAGLVFLSPVVYPWPGGIAWYYGAARPPLTGLLFSALIVPPIGVLTIDGATKAVFAPNQRPAGYIKATRALQALRPDAFQHNAREIAALSDWAKGASPRYRKIKAPTVIIAGDADKTVSTDIHARHLARDISGSTLIVIHNLGHKSDYVAANLVVAAIEKLSGKRSDLRAASKALERRIAHDGKD
ncbi:alpha/beta hydrolase [Rhizobium sp. P44RR-XXIV]|uniref:alpha/beta fold hydrolase n=1 Tax=Rhizobium sp. P44RR-XXIV TaxID=1921145 RepID=UPI0009842C5A|nr:alpha/beta hydrolase [Rhizobium sp. P44RR-XXIV]TIX87909.1 alpha/beta hydrolase [Rhizobium sp. P44RR-XXIV]